MLPPIARFAIYPSIGVARVGNSPDGYFFGPELPGPHPTDPDRFRDDQGRIKRQAARFRVYAISESGEVIREITSADAEIRWTVQVANTKAAWYDFDQALDIPASEGKLPPTPPTVSVQRNATVADRESLAIRPSPVSVCGPDVNAKGQDPSCAFQDGRFLGKEVYLGELRTDAEGRLIFLGGRGDSATPSGQPAVTFANNDGWHDDVSDGPVDATIVWRGETWQAEGAWVITGPPNYAPGVQGMVTGYDLLLQVGASFDPSLLPARPEFHQHIYPILRRLTQNEWVNAGHARDFGFGTPSNLLDPALVRRLADPSEAERTLRNTVFQWFRKANYSAAQSAAQPKMYGDAVTLETTATDPRTWMAILESQWRWLEQWARGDFEVGAPLELPAWEDLSPAGQVRYIDQGVLDETLGGPFHPGAEFTWPMRQAMMYSAPFRIKRRTLPRPPMAASLNSEHALAEGGPLDGSEAGDITRWMAVPWQTDTSSCLSGYVPYVDDYLPTFWPARVPNDVLTSDQYAVLMDPNSSAADRQRAFAFNRREKWLRDIKYRSGIHYPPKTIPSQRAINHFIEVWWQVGIVTEEAGPGGDFPEVLHVETGRTVQPLSAESRLLQAASEEPARSLLEDWIRTRRR